MEPKFLDPQSSLGEPDIVLRKGTQTFNVQCKAMDPSASSAMSFDLYQYMSGSLARINQDNRVHGSLSVKLKVEQNKPLKRKDVDRMLNRIRRMLERGLIVSGWQASEGIDFKYSSFANEENMSVPLHRGAYMFANGYLYREFDGTPPASCSLDRTITSCEVIGAAYPQFEGYVLKKIEEAARDAPKEHPLIICIHLYPPVQIHEFCKSPVIQHSMVPKITDFFDRHRHVSLVLVSSDAQQIFPIGETTQTTGTPAWELESQHWNGERPDYDPSS